MVNSYSHVGQTFKFLRPRRCWRRMTSRPGVKRQLLYADPPLENNNIQPPSPQWNWTINSRPRKQSQPIRMFKCGHWKLKLRTRHLRHSREKSWTLSRTWLPGLRRWYSEKSTWTLSLPTHIFRTEYTSATWSIARGRVPNPSNTCRKRLDIGGSERGCDRKHINWDCPALDDYLQDDFVRCNKAEWNGCVHTRVSGDIIFC